MTIVAARAFAEEASGKVFELEPEYVYGRNRKPTLGYRKPEVFDPLSDRLYQSGYRNFPPTAIPDELKDEIFEPFRRHGSHAAGLGLGLFIVRRFAELQGGRSWVEDTEGGGATFKVALPAAG